jgi:regulatory protein
MKTIKEIVKKTKHYDVKFNDDIIPVEPEIFLKYHLKLMDTLDDKTYKALIDDNAYIYYDKLGIVRLKKMQTTKELKDYLISKGAKEALIKQLVHKYSERKYLDDFAYAKMYTQMKRNTNGPKVIFNYLREKGISNEIIEGFTKRIDEHMVLSALIPKKIKTIKNKSQKQIIQTIKGYYLRKGFSLEAIESQIKKSISNIEVDEIGLIKKEYIKLLKKYKNKDQDKSTEYQIIQKLYAKGFKIEDIKKAINT